jgi:probable rRNA maturation factor
MARYNAELVGHEGTTDVITFSYFDTMDEYADGETMIELIINPDAAVREGSKRAGGYAREMVLYLVHGLLHSAGEDDLSPAPRRRMRRREKSVWMNWKNLLISKPYSKRLDTGTSQQYINKKP